MTTATTTVAATGIMHPRRSRQMALSSLKESTIYENESWRSSKSCLDLSLETSTEAKYKTTSTFYRSTKKSSSCMNLSSLAETTDDGLSPLPSPSPVAASARYGESRSQIVSGSMARSEEITVTNSKKSSSMTSNISITNTVTSSVTTKLEETSLYLPCDSGGDRGGVARTQKLYLPRKKSLRGLNRGYQSDCSLDQYLSGIPSISSRCDLLLKQKQQQEKVTSCCESSSDHTKEIAPSSSRFNVPPPPPSLNENEKLQSLTFDHKTVLSSSPGWRRIPSKSSLSQNNASLSSISSVEQLGQQLHGEHHQESEKDDIKSNDSNAYAIDFDTHQEIVSINNATQNKNDPIISQSMTKVQERQGQQQQKRWLNVMQGEVAHATPSQTDVVVSTDATTCHIVAVRSTYQYMSPKEPLTSVTHIDRAAYEKSLEDMITYHIQHHMGSVPIREENEGLVCDDFWGENEYDPTNKRETSNTYGEHKGNERSFIPLMSVDDKIPSLDFSEVSSSSPRHNERDDEMDNFVLEEDGDVHPSETTNDKIQMELHLMGGYLDKKGTSQELTEHLMRLFSELAQKYDQQIHMTLKTALVSCMNTHLTTSNFDSSQKVPSPCGRGLGIETLTGKVFLIDRPLTVEERGPALELRAARLMFDTSGELNLIHKTECSSASTHTTTKQETSSVIQIQPFHYEIPSNHSSALTHLLRLSDHDLLKQTSTSPECENPNEFCSTLRKTLSFVQSASSSNEIFVEQEPLIFERL